MKQNNHLFLVDGSGYIFRAYHAVPSLTRKSDGLPVGAVAGFCNMLWKLLCNARDTAVGVVPTHFAVIFDYSSKTFRNEIYPQYKAHRKKPPEDLIPQFALIRQATHAFNLPCIEKEGFEADDIIATYAQKAEQAGMDVTIISSDKDLMQLVNDHISMYDSMKDRQISIPEVIEKWGVPPEKMIDFQAMTGDSTDNVPGIIGIGPKTAVQLIETFGDLDTLLKRAEEIPQNKRRENIITHAEQARISRQLVKLRSDVPLDTDLDGLVLKPQDGPRLISFLKAMEFVRLIDRVAKATDTNVSTIETQHVDVDWGEEVHEPDTDIGDKEANKLGTCVSKFDIAVATPSHLAELCQSKALGKPFDTDSYKTILEVEELAQWLDESVDQGFFAFDIETDSLNPMIAGLVGFSISYQPGKAAYVPLQHVLGNGGFLGESRVSRQMESADALRLLKPVLENPEILKIAHNMKYDWLIMHRHGIDIKSFDDTMLISYVLDAGGALTHGMDALSERWLGHKRITYKEIVESGRVPISFAEVELSQATGYAAEDADVTLRLWQVLKPQLVAKRLVRIYERTERFLVEVLARMEKRGIMVDRKILGRLSGELDQGAAVIEDEIYKLVGEKFNIGSPKQLADILFGKLHFSGGLKTKTGHWSTSAQVLEDLAAEGHELPRKIINWRQLKKLRSTYADVLPSYINTKTGRVHTNYIMAGTTTGRLASSDPNLQNIPMRTAEGRQIRTAFIAGPGNLLLSADYSQIELRILAHVADITELKAVFSKDLDVHAMTASEMFDIPIKDMSAEIRRKAKAVNFGIIYGISAFGLANQLGIPREEAGKYIRTYLKRFPSIQRYIEKTKAFVREHGYIETIFGRRVHYPEINSSNPQVRAFNERSAINASMQGAAADIIRRAMIRMDGALKKAALSAALLLQVHDELVFELPESEVEKTIPVVCDVMEQAAMPAVNISVLLKVEARAAKNWDEAH
ncbi:MAG: DNA polymerase I [Candidatus Tokpelaia sp. JSC189]|nr:MAG: DNA polymerase I [Candidatus Tokpelaia sp. JSC189]